MIGATLGHYTIISKLGAGGMGEVYEAEDTSLERRIALKLLPAEWAETQERVARFRQEAKTLAALDHPNIVTIHSVEEADGRFFLTMQLVEGRNLDALIASGAMPIDRVMEIALPITEALAAAHDQGVVHRDLKPANVMVTPEGRVKVLDFGLAKLIGSDEEDPQNSPTLTAVTAQGAILGTVGYMSPEQAAGRPIDHRSDQFSFGVMTYQMLSGRRPFGGETTTESLAAILRDQPEPLAQAAPESPLPLRWIVERCLEKDPDHRYASTRDLALELASVGPRLPQLATTAAAPASTGRRRMISWVLAIGAAVAVSILTLGPLDPLGREEPQHPTYERLTFRRGTVTAARFDPNASATFYSAAWEGRPERLFLQRAGSLDPLPVGPQGSRLLSVSATGEILLLSDLHRVSPFVEAGTLARMSVTGSPRMLAEGVSDALWGPDNELLALVREEAEGAVLEYPPGEVRYETPGMIWYLRATSDGERLAFADVPHRGSNTGPIGVLDRSGEIKQVGKGGWMEGLDWSPDESEIWFPRFSRLMAVDMDGSKRVVATYPQRIVLFDVDPDGRLLLGVEPRRWQLEGKTADNDEARDLTWLGWSVPFDISEDGETILFNECGAGVCTVCLRGFDDETPVVLGEGFGLSLSPDGAWALSVPPWETSKIELIATGSDERRSVSVEGTERIHYVRWSRDGETFFLNGSAPGEGSRIFRLDAAGGTAVPLTPDTVAFGLFALSPDETRVAVTMVTGGIGIFSLDSGELLRHLELGEEPISWSADGQAVHTAAPGSTTTIHRIDLASGKRTITARLEPADPAGVTQITPIVMTPDGSAIAYGYIRSLTDLFLVDGLE